MKKAKIMLGIVLIILLVCSVAGAYRFFSKPERGLLIELPSPDRTMGRNALVSWLLPKYEYYLQVQVMTREGFRTVYLGSSHGEVLIPSSKLSKIRSAWKDVNPAVLVDVWIVEPETGEAYEVGTFSTRLTDDSIGGLQHFAPSFSRDDLDDLRVFSREESERIPTVPPTRGFFAGYRWRTKKEYLREDDYPGGMYLPVLILDNRKGKATVLGAYKVEVQKSSSSSSGLSIGFSTTVIRGSRLSSKSELSIENGLESGEIRIEVKKGNEFIRSIIDGEVKNVGSGQVGLIAIKGEPYIALQVLQRCYVDEFRKRHCFDTDQERVLITVSDVERAYDPGRKAYLIKTFSFVNPPRSVYPAGNFERLVKENAEMRTLTTLYGENQAGRSSHMEIFLDEYDTYSNSYVPLLAMAVAFQPEAWPAFMIGLSAVGGVYITNEEHEKAFGAFTIVDQSSDVETTVKYVELRYHVKNANHNTRFPFAYLLFG
ncbi:hypothetical protein [Thermococcus sp. JdF3]|uniref:hypothetical protein n=1 Tax=Thermococcus sp. JdF3 TaxID=1638258 RepID=UPI0014395969|nr:hypothetical protein [Thermococcus sp. JdF3]NJE00627.1 hypothetical protein [Thermococcus sp. JdF3]